MRIILTMKLLVQCLVPHKSSLNLIISLTNRYGALRCARRAPELPSLQILSHTPPHLLVLFRVHTRSLQVGGAWEATPIPMIEDFLPWDRDCSLGYGVAGMRFSREVEPLLPTLPTPTHPTGKFAQGGA